ncbi:hypothetical protein MMC22_002733 [Lobaria immixta]|nr:hypothetical protein [Lobaria immixta]
MPWRPLARIAFAVAIYPFQASSPADLPLELGDELYIIEQGGINGSWYRGYLVAPPSLLAGLTSVKGQTLEAKVFSGIFPRCCVEVREVLGDSNGDEKAHSIRYNDEGSNFNHANGGLRQDHTASTSRNGFHYSDSRSNSLRTRRSFANGESPQDSGIGNAPSRSSSHRKPDRYEQGARRKISPRSSRSHLSLRSSLSLTPLSTGIRESGAKRPSAPVPMLKIGDETPTCASEPLVDEVASCLREWHSRNLHELLLGRRYSVLEKISDLVYQLDLSRRQILHGVLTPHELNTRREKTVWDLVSGNKMLSKEIIVRDPKQNGRLLTRNDSVIEVTKLQSIMSLLDKRPVSQHDSIKLYHLMVDLKAFANSGLNSPSLTISLYSRAQGGAPKQLTESFAIDIPLQDHFNTAALSGKFRTLFTDLSSADVGEASGSESDLYLVVKVHASQSIEPVSIGDLRKENSSEKGFSPSKTAASSSSESPTFKGGRRSIMWAQKQLGSTRRRGHHDPRISRVRNTADASVDAADTRGRPETRESTRPLTQQGPQYVRRSVGVGVLNIKNLLGQSKAVEQTMSIWSPVGANVDIHDSRLEFDELIRELNPSRNGHYAKSKTLDHIRLNVQCFESPDANVLITRTPTLLQNISQTPKIGFSGAPTRARSDIYLTLSEAFLPPQALLSHPERGTVQMSSSLNLRNVQLTLEVRKQSGERIEQCIFPSSNGPGLTAWRTTAAFRGEPWNQMIKLVIPSDDVPEAHLIMSVADAPKFPFALCWMPLRDEGAFIRDGSHTPLLYLYDQLTSSSDKGRGAYLAFPWNSRGKDDVSKEEVLTGPVAVLKLETYLCSTIFSQDKVLLGILKWREQSRAQILDLLKRFVFVSEIEIVKLVNEVFDALFGILVDHAGKDNFDDLVFDSLVTVLGIVHDRRFNLGPLVDHYAETKFDYPFATPCLLRSYLRLLAKPADPRNSRRLRATFKVGRQMLKFIISAREKQKIKEAEIGITAYQPTFSGEVKSIFKALEALMKDSSPILIGSKTLIVQHMHTWLPELRGCFSEVEIFHLASSFLDACEGVQSKLILYKLVLVLNLTKMTLFTKSSVRHSMVSNTSRWIYPYWGASMDDSDQWREQIRLCCSIASVQIEEFGPEASVYFVKTIESYRSIQAAQRISKDIFSLLFPTNYPFSSKQITPVSNFDEALIELAAVLAQLAEIPLAKHFNQSLPDLTDTLFTTLDVIMSILSEEAFPSSWLSLHIYHHKSSLEILESLFEILVVDFVPSPDDADDFNTDLWKRFLLTLLTLVRSSSLALETFAEQKRRAVWKIAGDVREQGADLLKRSWEAIGWESSPEDEIRYGCTRLGGYQVQYVPSLVAPIVELCFSVHEGLRGVAVRILQTMTVSEWTLSEDLSVIQTEMINCLDIMFKSKNLGEGIVQKFFVNELLEMFDSLSRAPSDPLWEAVKELVSTIDELLDLLGAVHSPDTTEPFRIMHTLRLMDFLKDMQKEDIFIRYVHQLADVQVQLHNSTEAGLALRLHADLYQWDAKMLEPITEPAFPAQSSFERKEQLYFEMINRYEDGAAWDCALTSYRELAHIYEHHNYDFAKLARTQRSMAKLYETIAKGERHAPRYFRVVYKGLGFPTSLRDKEFIFEGERGERQSVFTDRMRQQHPAAQIAAGDLDEVEGQYLQIFAVSPHRDLEHRVFQQSRVTQSIREHLLSSRTHRFSVTSRRHSPTSGVKDQWIEKTVFSTAESFPNILRRSEIVGVDVLCLSPLQTALERTSRKTSEIALLDKRIRDGDDSGFAALTEAINNSVDPSSVSSVAQYHQLLPEPIEYNDDDLEEPPLEPLQNALKLALVDHASTLKHSLNLFSRRGLERTTLSQALFSTFAPEFAILIPYPDPSSRTTSPSPPPSKASPSIPPLPNGGPIASPSSRPLSPGPRSRGSRLSLAFLKSPPKTPLPTTNGGTPSAPSSSTDTESEAPASEDGSAAGRSGDPRDEEERPMTATSGRSGTMRKRLSMLGIRKGEKRVKAGGGGGDRAIGGMG